MRILTMTVSLPIKKTEVDEGANQRDEKCPLAGDYGYMRMISTGPSGRTYCVWTQAIVESLWLIAPPTMQVPS
jgi:hypothetical protein